MSKISNFKPCSFVRKLLRKKAENSSKFERILLLRLFCNLNKLPDIALWKCSLAKPPNRAFWYPGVHEFSKSLDQDRFWKKSESVAWRNYHRKHFRLSDHKNQDRICKELIFSKVSSIRHFSINDKSKFKEPRVQTKKVARWATLTRSSHLILFFWNGQRKYQSVDIQFCQRWTSRSRPGKMENW